MVRCQPDIRVELVIGLRAIVGIPVQQVDGDILGRRELDTSTNRPADMGLRLLENAALHILDRKAGNCEAACQVGQERTAIESDAAA